MRLYCTFMVIFLTFTDTDDVFHANVPALQVWSVGSALLAWNSSMREHDTVKAESFNLIYFSVSEMHSEIVKESRTDSITCHPSLLLLCAVGVKASQVEVLQL